jgi:hypothetical protein
VRAHRRRQKAWKARASAACRYAGVRSQPPPNQALPATCGRARGSGTRRALPRAELRTRAGAAAQPPPPAPLPRSRSSPQFPQAGRTAARAARPHARVRARPLPGPRTDTPAAKPNGCGRCPSTDTRHLAACACTGSAPRSGARPRAAWARAGAPGGRPGSALRRSRAGRLPQARRQRLCCRGSRRLLASQRPPPPPAQPGNCLRSSCWHRIPVC